LLGPPEATLHRLGAESAVRLRHEPIHVREREAYRPLAAAKVVHLDVCVNATSRALCNDFRCKHAAKWDDFAVARDDHRPIA
jgi:hypothetical protein